MKLEGSHNAAVQTFEWRNSLIVSGDKQGKLVFWVIHFLNFSLNFS